MRFLLSILRTVDNKQDEYQAAWSALRDQAAALDVRAWMFRARDDDARFIEFLEWKGTADSQINRVLQMQLDGLQQFGNAVTEQWMEP